MLQSLFNKPIVRREQFTALVISQGNHLGNRNDRLLGSSSVDTVPHVSHSVLYPHSALLLLLQLHQAKEERRNSEADQQETFE